MPIYRVGVQATNSSAGQGVDFDGGSFASDLSLVNVSGESVAYSTNGGTAWTTVSAGASASIGSIAQDQFRLRRVASGAYPLPVDVDVTAVSALTSAQLAGLYSGQIVSGTGGVFGLSEVSPVVAVTATSTAFTGAHLYRGIRVRALVGGPQTATLYDATSATGTPIDVVVFNATGTFFWDRPSDLLPGVGGRRPGTTGVHIVFSGGTSRTVDVMVEAA